MRIIDLDTMPYQAAWDEQLRYHAEVLENGEPVLITVEHPPTITFGRRADDAEGNLKVDRDLLKRKNVALVESDRGGDITYHGPGQLICYPIVRIADHGLTVGSYMRLLQDATIQALAKFHLPARTDPDAVGVWVDPPHVRGVESAKIAAMGVRVRKGVTLHGLALNIETRLSDFEMIVPCGLERPVTSVQAVLGSHAPSYIAVKAMMVRCLKSALAR
ncbi:MAG: lipoyl(octanoyl) transferase LipB [Planctomycetota bacterium]